MESHINNSSNLNAKASTISEVAIFTFVIFPFYLVVSMIGNVAIVKVTKGMTVIWNQPINIIVLNNSICNILIAGVLYPLYVTDLAVGDWIYSRQFCVFSKFVEYIVLAVMNLTLVSTCFCQLRIITSTVQRRKIKHKTLKNALFFIWIVSVLFSTILTFTEWNNNHPLQRFIYGWVSPKFQKKILWLILCLVAFFIFSKLILMSVYTVFSLKLSTRNIQNVWKLHYSVLYARRLKQKQQIVISTLRILSLFFLTSTPCHMFQIYTVAGTNGERINRHDLAYYCVNLLAYWHTFFSPILFARWLGKQYTWHGVLWKKISSAFCGNIQDNGNFVNYTHNPARRNASVSSDIM